MNCTNLPRLYFGRFLNHFTYFLFLLIFLPVFTVNAQTLVWEENFNAATVNPSKWTYDFGDGCERALCGWGNSEMQYYTSRSENVRTENGSLVIEAKKEKFNNSAFTSGRIKTEGRVHFKYGTVEARIKLPNVTNGLWPAFWTLGTVGPSWPSIGEIDIMEVGSGSALQAGLGNKRVTSASHWSNASGAHEFNVFSKDAAVDLSADYHLYKMVWTRQYIKMYLDNEEYYSFNISGGAAANLSEFHTPHYLLLNLAVGGAYTNIFDVNAITAPIPGKMYVDYVKLYQNPGDELIVGDDVAVTGNFGVLTETTPVSNFLNYGTNAELYYWNNLTPITSPTPAAFEGGNLWAVHANANDWFGMGVSNNYVNLNNFSDGSLRFQFKTSYQGQFKFGIKTGHGETWLNVAAGTQKYGIVRDGAWHQVIIPIANFVNPQEGRNLDLMSLKGAFMFAGDVTPTATDFYFDDIYFYRTGAVTATAPLTAAPTPPARLATDVVSLFSGAYADLAGTNWFPDWGQTTVVSDTSIESNPTKKYVNLNYQGVQFSPNVNATGMTKLHLDLWTPNATAFDVFLINEGPVEKKVTLTPMPAGWNSFDIDVNATNFPSINFSSIYQLKMEARPSGSKVYLDNIYFYRPVILATTAPLTAAPTPPARNAADVISLFSGAYTEVTGTNWFPDWGQSTVVSDTSIESNATKKYLNLNYQGVNFTPAINATGMTKLHIDLWTPNVTEFDVFLINPNPQLEKKLTLMPTLSGWNSYDIDLTDANFPGIKFGDIYQFKLEGRPGGGKVYLDNIYFWKAPSTVVGMAPTVSITSPANNAQFNDPANVTITANAADADGTVTKVEFYIGGTLLGEDLTSPYSYNWNAVASGDYTLTAKVTDNDGNVVTSAPIAISVKPVPCTGTAVSGDYTYEVYAQGGKVYFTFKPLAPIAGSNLAIINIKEGSGGFGGYGMTASGANFTFNRTIANGVNLTFYFTYNTPPAGERNSSANPHTYFVGTVCTPGAPTITLTSPVEGANFTAPANITLTANAADAGGTISKVEFYNGTSLLGTDLTSPYSFDWMNVAAGPYSITAKAIDNSELSTTSAPVNIVVNTPNLNGFCGTAVNGDYEYKAETANGMVTFRLHPLMPIEGSLYAVINISAPATINANMTRSGSDFVYSQPYTDGTAVTFYFTYNTPPGGERNSGDNRHTYTVGSSCLGITGSTPLVQITSPVNNANFNEPAAISIDATSSDNDGSVSKVDFYNGATLLGTDATSPYSFNWTNVAAGNYTISAWATDNNGYTTISNLVNVVINVNAAGGFCGTVANGDYNYKVETKDGNVTFTFFPLTPIAGSNNALIYIREGLTGGYPGYPMTKIGNDFVFTKAIADGTPLSIYFTYNTPPGGERNSSATPHSYTVGTNCVGTLPVSLLNYTASLKPNGSVLVSWTTANEVNNDYFVVEKSVDGINFSTLGKIKGEGLSSLRKEYGTTDVAPVKGINYYRLSQVDKDGRKTMYGVKTVLVNTIKSILRIYPNPLSGTRIYISSNQPVLQKSSVQLFDKTGKKIFAGFVVEQQGIYQIDLKVKPAAGIYMLSIGNNMPVKLVIK